MTYDVLIYCPDRHLTYDGWTPDRHGVGGGVTARVRMGRALARAGHPVRMMVNCPREETIEGVGYVPLADVERLEADILILTTSGGGLDLRPALELERRARLTIVWVQGTLKPAGLENFGPDSLYAPSNFIRDVAVDEWGLPPDWVYVSYNGYEERQFQKAEARRPVRDLHRLVYFSHPSKGLEPAKGVLRLLRMRDPRFELHVYGGEALWGGAAAPAIVEPGVVDHGMVGQRRLIEGLLTAGFSLQLQTRQEPGALALGEAQRAGCILVGSNVGCYPEMIREGETGFLVHGDPAEPAIQQAAADRIRALTENGQRAREMRQAGQALDWSTDRFARAWKGHWHALLESSVQMAGALACGFCGGQALHLADGAHCTQCGRFKALKIPHKQHKPQAQVADWVS